MSRSGLVQLVEQLRREVGEVRSENERLRGENAALRKEVTRLKESGQQGGSEGKNPTQRLDESYSVAAEERRRDRDQDRAGSGNKGPGKKGSGRRGRRPTEEKIESADVREIVLPEGFSVEQCTWIRDRPVWRIIGGQSVRVVYGIWHGPNGEHPVIDGVLPRSEFGVRPGDPCGDRPPRVRHAPDTRLGLSDSDEVRCARCAHVGERPSGAATFSPSGSSKWGVGPAHVRSWRFSGICRSANRRRMRC